MTALPPRRSLGTKLRLAIFGSTLVALVLAVGTFIAYDPDTWHLGGNRIAGYGVLALGLVLLAAALTWAVSSWLEAIVTQPLGAMADIAREVVRDGVLSRRAPRQGEDEVGELVDAFNGLLDEIERRKSEQESAALEKDREVAERRHVQALLQRLNEELERSEEHTSELQSP